MSTIAALNVAITADTQAFNRGMTDAANKTKEFDSHILTSRHSLQTFSGIAGASSGAVGHLVHAFEAFPGPVGLAIGATFAFVEASRAHDEAVKKAAEEQEHFNDVMRKTSEGLQTQLFSDKYATDAHSKMETLQKEIDETRKKAIEMGDAMSFSNFAAKLGGGNKGMSPEMIAKFDEINALQGQQREWLKLNNIFEDLGNEMDKIGDDKFALKMADNSDMLEPLKAQVLALQDALRKLPEGTKEWRVIKSELQSTQLEIKKTYDEFNKLDDETRKFNETVNQFNLKAATAPGSLERLNVELDAANNSAAQMKRQLDALPEGAAAYAASLKEWHAGYLKVLDLQEQIHAKTQAEADKESNKQFKSDFDYVKKMTEEAEKLKQVDPLEKFRQDMEKAVKLWKEGFIDDKTLNQTLRKKEDEFAKIEDKENGHAGVFKQFDASKISVAGLAMQHKGKQEITSKQLEQTNKVLEQINQKIGIKSDATVARG